MSILEDVEYIHLVHQFWEFWSEKTQGAQTYRFVGPLGNVRLSKLHKSTVLFMHLLVVD